MDNPTQKADTVRSIRVMQTFGTPRSTTNPYIVQLARALEQEPGVDHVPFSWRAALAGSFDVVHVHWADTLLSGRNIATRTAKRIAMALFLARLKLARIPVVRTVHNLSAPDGIWIDRILARGLERLTSLRIHLTPTTPEQPGVPSVTILHGHYRTWFAQFPHEESRRGQLGYVGLIKAYKGIDALLRAYAQTTTMGISLRIAGKPADEGSAAIVSASVSKLRDARATLRYVSEAELTSLVTSSELIVLPYRSMHNSGAALAALSLARPVLVPANETNQALAVEMGDGWVHMFDGELEGSDLDRALLSVRSTAHDSGPNLSAREWTNAGRLHREAYERALTHRVRRRER